MRLLLISDTHGHLEMVASLAQQTRADAVVHAGDLGFYDQDSVERLDSRELFLRVVHSDLHQAVKKRAKCMHGGALRDFIRSELPLSDLVEWLRRGRGFPLPVYATWGNHEDASVIADLLAGRTHVSNLFLLGQAHVGPFRMFGLGGNILSHLLHYHEIPLARGKGKVHATQQQILELLDNTPPRNPGELRMLVTHVSPGKEPLVGLLAAALDADLTISGHMGSPLACTWNDFAVREPAEAMAKLDAALEELPDVLRARLPPPRTSDRPAAHWYRGAFHLNLPDAPEGYAVLEWKDGKVCVETFSTGLRIPVR